MVKPNCQDNFRREAPLPADTSQRQDLVMTDREKVYYNAFIDILARMIEKYGPQVLKELEEKRASELP